MPLPSLKGYHLAPPSPHSKNPIVASSIAEEEVKQRDVDGGDTDDMAAVSAALDALNHEAGLRILSLDGGGMRGLGTALILAELEAVSGKRIHQMFDLIVGSGSGGVLALGLGLKSDSFSVVKGRNFFRAMAAVVYPQGSCRGCTDCFRGMCAESMYDPTPLQNLLSDALGEASIMDPSNMTEDKPKVAVVASRLSTDMSTADQVLIHNYDNETESLVTASKDKELTLVSTAFDVISFERVI